MPDAYGGVCDMAVIEVADDAADYLRELMDDDVIEYFRAYFV